MLPRPEPKLDLAVTVLLDFIPLTPYLTHNHHAPEPNLIEIKDFHHLQQLMTKLENVIASNNKNSEFSQVLSINVAGKIDDKEIADFSIVRLNAHKAFRNFKYYISHDLNLKKTFPSALGIRLRE